MSYLLSTMSPMKDALSSENGQRLSAGQRLCRRPAAVGVLLTFRSEFSQRVLSPAEYLKQALVFNPLSAPLWRIRHGVSNRPRKTLELQGERGKTHRNQVHIFSFRPHPRLPVLPPIVAAFTPIMHSTINQSRQRLIQPKTKSKMPIFQVEPTGTKREN